MLVLVIFGALDLRRLRDRGDLVTDLRPLTRANRPASRGRSVRRVRGMDAAPLMGRSALVGATEPCHRRESHWLFTIASNRYRWQRITPDIAIRPRATQRDENRQ